MARIVSEVIGIRFSTLVRDGAEDDPIILTEEDLEAVMTIVNELNASDPTRVVELDTGE